jgi:Leucine-rich repeat (LRR) protein
LLADGDNLNGVNDENNCRFITPLVRGHNARVEFWPKDIGVLNGWIDFNGDGDWDDSFEHCIQDLAVRNSGHPDTAIFKVPVSTIDGYSYARFRISQDAGISYTGLAVFGSVEDYRVLLGRAALCERDSLALVALYRSTNGDSWANHRNWLSGPLYTWYGVELDGCRVRALRLPKNNLTGVLPREIGDLDAMETLDLSTVTFADTFPNTISGNLPAELGQCRAMQVLNLANNRFSGSIPAALGNLSQLLILRLQGNELTGEIPAELGHLSRLQELSLNRNMLEGEIPIALCSLSNLQEMYLSNNQLSGTIPDEIGRLSNLRLLILGSNHLRGPIPASLYMLTHLTHLGLYDNELEGALSADIGHITNLTALVLYENRFDGELPDALFTLSHLQQLRLNSNRFNGVISSAISSLGELQHLNLEENSFSGAVPDEIAGLNTLESISLHYNSFTHFPDVSSLPALAALQLQNNRLTFADIEPNMHVATRYFSYSPQDSLGIERDTTLSVGMPFELHVVVDGTANAYQWQRNGVDVAGANTATLRIPAVAAEHIGSYTCRITNSIAVELTLYTRPIHLLISGITAVPEPSTLQPNCYRLEQNHPNPFNPETLIEYQLPQSCPVWLGVFNLQGQCVRKLVSEQQAAGVKHIVWDARSDDGKKLSSGIYIYRLEAGEYRAYRKMVLLQ